MDGCPNDYINRVRFTCIHLHWYNTKKRPVNYGGKEVRAYFNLNSHNCPHFMTYALTECNHFKNNGRQNKVRLIWNSVCTNTGNGDGGKMENEESKTMKQ